MDPKIIIGDVITGVTDKVKEWHDEFEKHIYDILLNKIDNHVNTIYQRAANVYPDNKFGEFDTTEIFNELRKTFPRIDVIKELIDSDEWIITFMPNYKFGVGYTDDSNISYFVTNKLRIISLPLRNSQDGYNVGDPRYTQYIDKSQKNMLPQSLLSCSMPSDYIILLKMVTQPCDNISKPYYLPKYIDISEIRLHYRHDERTNLKIQDLTDQLSIPLEWLNTDILTSIQNKNFIISSAVVAVKDGEKIFEKQISDKSDKFDLFVMFAYLTKKYYARFDEWSKIEKIGYELLETKRSDTENHELKVKAEKKNIELTQKCDDMKNIIKDKNSEIEKLQQTIRKLRQQILQMETEND